MGQPTKADLAAAVTRLTGENEALRDLLAAAVAYAEVPHPASHDGRIYEYELERRADTIAVWANGDREDMTPAVYVLVLQDRAKHLREEAARPVRYEVPAEPAEAVAALAESIVAGTPVITTDDEPANPPYHMTGNMIGPSCGAEDGGYICNAQDGHDGPDHVAYGSEDVECYRWPLQGDEPERPVFEVVHADATVTA